MNLVKASTFPAIVDCTIQRIGVMQSHQRSRIGCEGNGDVIVHE